MPQTISSVSIKAPDGTTKKLVISEFITSDDVLMVAMKNVAAEIKLGIEYQTPASPFVRDFLLLTNFVGV